MFVASELLLTPAVTFTNYFAGHLIGLNPVLVGELCTSPPTIRHSQECRASKPKVGLVIPSKRTSSVRVFGRFGFRLRIELIEKQETIIYFCCNSSPSCCDCDLRMLKQKINNSFSINSVLNQNAQILKHY